MLWLYQRMMFGNLDKPENQNLKDCNFREIAYMVPLIILMFWIGLYPKPYLNIMGPTVDKLVERVNPAYFQTAKQNSLPQISVEKLATIGKTDMRSWIANSYENQRDKNVPPIDRRGFQPRKRDIQASLGSPKDNKNVIARGRAPKQSLKDFYQE
jgi:hypothetical protein